MGRWFVNQGDALRANFVSSVAASISVFVTILTPDGEYRRVRSNVPFTTNGTRVPEIAVVLVSTLPEGEVLSLNVSTFTSSVKRGACYVQAYVIEQPTMTQGYVFTGKDILLGESEAPGPAGGYGQVLVVGLTQPAPGADYATVVSPANSYRKIRGFFGQLVTSATAANREFSIQEFVTTIRGGVVAGEIQTATLTVDYVGVDGSVSSSGVTSNLAGGVTEIGLGNLIGVGGVFDIAFKTYNIQGTDQWSAGALIVEEWVIP